jgi:hypothetical protein
MDKKTKILNFIFWSVIIVSISFTFYKTIIRQDFVIINYSEDTIEEVPEILDSEGDENIVDTQI